MNDDKYKKICTLMAEMKELNSRGFKLIENILQENGDLISTNCPFSEFWDRWKAMGGKKIAPKTCKYIYSKIPEETREIIFRMLTHQQEERRLKKKYGVQVPWVKNPSTWLNQECWNNEVSTEQEIQDEANQGVSLTPTSRQQQSISAIWDD